MKYVLYAAAIVVVAVGVAAAYALGSASNVGSGPASGSPTPVTRSPVATPSPSTPAPAGPVGQPLPIHDGYTVEIEAELGGEDAGVIRGFDGQAFMDAWEFQGFTSACTGPKVTTGTLLAWTCGDLIGPLNSYDLRITFIGESPSAIHLIVASVATADNSPIDADYAGGFLGYVAETADFTGADTAAARAWALENGGQDGQLEISGVTYTLSGTAERRVLEIAPSVSSN